MPFRTLDGVEVAGKRVLLRADLNVPVRDGRITDLTRIERLSPTIRELSDKGAQGHRVQPFRPAERQARPGDVAGARWPPRSARCLGTQVAFADDCIGPAAQQAVAALPNGDVLVLENTRFHAGEEAQRSRLRRRPGRAGRPLRQRRVLRRAPRARQHRGRGPSAARLRRPPDAGRTRGAGRRARQPAAPGDGDRRRRQGVHQAGTARQPGRQGGRAGDRRRDGQHVPRRAGHRGRQLVAGSRHARHRARHPGRRAGPPAARSCCRSTRSSRASSSRTRPPRPCRSTPSRPTR